MRQQCELCDGTGALVCRRCSGAGCPRSRVQCFMGKSPCVRCDGRGHIEVERPWWDFALPVVVDTGMGPALVSDTDIGVAYGVFVALVCVVALWGLWGWGDGVSV